MGWLLTAPISQLYALFNILIWMNALLYSLILLRYMEINQLRF